MFADDTNLFLQGDDINELQLRFNEELVRVSSWIKINKLSLNINKTHCLLFTRKSRNNLQLNIVIDGFPIELSNKTKFLGVVVSEDLNWKYHIEKITLKIAKGIGLLKKLKNKLNVSTLIQLYYSFIYPYLNYCNIIWGMAPKTYVNKLFLLQKKIIRVIFRLGFRESTCEILETLNMLTIYELNVFNLCVFMRKLLMNNVPCILRERFSMRADIHIHDTRSASLFNLPLCKSETRKKTVIFSGPSYFNHLLQSPLFHNVGLQSMPTFRRNLKTLVVSGYFM